MDQKQKTVTIKDIARISHVSIGTVDRVIHERGRVSKETEEKVKKAIKDSGYKPDFIASRLRQNEQLFLGVIMPEPEQDSGYWKLCLRGIKNAGADLSTYGVSLRYFFYDRYSEKSIVEKIQEATRSSCKGFVIAPVLTKYFRNTILEQKFPENISFFDSEVPDVPVISRIGQDSYQSGFLAGKLMSLLLCGDSNILVIDISENDYHLQRRIEGFIDYYRNELNKDIDTFVTKDTDSIDLVLNRLTSYFEHNPSPKGLFVPNATTHLYAKSCDSLNMKNIKIVGYDSVPENIYCLKNSMIDFIISQQPERQGAEALLNLFRHSFLQQDVPEKINMPIDIITKENCPEQM